MTFMSFEKSTARPKVRRTFTLDADIVDALATIAPDNPSEFVNVALRHALEHQAKRASLNTLVVDLDTQFGRPDQYEMDQAVSLLM